MAWCCRCAPNRRHGNEEDEHLRPQPNDLCLTHARERIVELEQENKHYAGIARDLFSEKLSSHRRLYE